MQTNCWIEIHFSPSKEEDGHGNNCHHIVFLSKSCLIYVPVENFMSPVENFMIFRYRRTLLLVNGCVCPST